MGLLPIRKDVKLVLRYVESKLWAIQTDLVIRPVKKTTWNFNE